MSHVAEMDYEMTYFAKTYGKTPIGWLNDIGCLNERLLAVHCIHLNDEDITLVNETKGEEYKLAGGFTERQKNMLIFGGLLNYTGSQK